MPHDVFISHSTKDKVFASAVCAKLEQRGIRCWIAPRDIKGGESWPEAITRGIEECSMMVLVFSHAALQSEPVENEITLASDCRKPVMPVRIENVDPKGSYAFLLAKCHWLDAMTEPVEQHLNKLASLILKRLGKSDYDSESASDTRIPPVFIKAPYTNPEFEVEIEVPEANNRPWLNTAIIAVCATVIFVSIFIVLHQPKRNLGIILPVSQSAAAPGTKLAASSPAPVAAPVPSNVAVFQPQQSAQFDGSDISISEFDGNSYDPGWTTTGTAFGGGPAHGTMRKQLNVSGWSGSGYVDSFYGYDRATGTLTSPQFLINRRYITLLVGGGNAQQAEFVDLVVNGVAVDNATGQNSENLFPVKWDVSQFQGQMGQIYMMDSATGPWGHILCDHIEETNN